MHIYTLQSWTPIQRKWLDRLAKQLTHETIIDSQFVNRAFSTDGGSKRLDNLLDGELENILEELSENLWQDTPKEAML